MQGKQLAQSCALFVATMFHPWRLHVRIDTYLLDSRTAAPRDAPVPFYLRSFFAGGGLFAQTYSAAVYNSSGTQMGTLSWTINQYSGNCGFEGQSYYQEWVYNNFQYQYTIGNVTSTQPLSGSAVSFNSPGGNCPPSGGITTGLGPVNDNQANVYTLNFTSQSGGNGYVNAAQTGFGGYVDPKYMVVGITYAPPGPSTNTFVNYTQSTYVGTTNSFSSSFADGSNTSLTLTMSGGILGVLNGKITSTYSSGVTQTTKTSSSFTSSVQLTGGERTSGTPDAYAPVDNDYDIIWIWLNPALLFSVSNTPGAPVTWDGYGYDAADENDPDIVGIPLGELNGHFPLQPEFVTSLQRGWAANQVSPSGDGPALTQQDMASIANEDPFNSSTYGQNYIGWNPPNGETADGRFTIADCHHPNSGFDTPYVNYVQPDIPVNPEIDTCQFRYTNMSTQAQTTTTSHTSSYTFDASLSGSAFLAGFSAALQSSTTLNWTTSGQASIQQSTTDIGTGQVQGPPCVVSAIGTSPCDPNYTGPIQFYIYQDNKYGTFMFAPEHYY